MHTFRGIGPVWLGTNYVHILEMVVNPLYPLESANLRDTPNPPEGVQGVNGG